MQDKKIIKMYPKWQFEKYARLQGWKFDYMGLHEAHINSNKLPDSMKFQPSYLVDQDFSNQLSPLTWVEVKSCSKLGVLKILKSEWEIHQKFNEVWGVYYAIYQPATKDFAGVIHIAEIEELLKEDGDYLVFSIEDI